MEVAKLYGSKKSLLLEKLENFNLDELKLINNVGITASASAPEILVQNFIKILNKKYKINIFKENQIKENVFFKIPKHLSA